MGLLGAGEAWGPIIIPGLLKRRGQCGQKPSALPQRCPGQGQGLLGGGVKSCLQAVPFTAVAVKGLLRNSFKAGVGKDLPEQVRCPCLVLQKETETQRGPVLHP